MKSWRHQNASNSYQGSFKRVLCVCSAGLLRSPTAAWILSNAPFNFNTRAVGVEENFALIYVDEVHVHWANEIVVMDDMQKFHVEQIIAEHSLASKPIHVLSVEDDFGYRDPELVRQMEIKLKEIFGV